MTTREAHQPTAYKTLRLWPGVIAVVMMWIIRFGGKIVVPGFDGFSLGMQGTMALSVVLILWWLLLSRAPWPDRLGAIILMAGALGAIWGIKHESMGPLWLIGYAVPVLFLAFVTAVVGSRRRPDGARRMAMAGAIVLACLGWGFARTDGIDGDHNASFAWRWSKTVEEQLVADTAAAAAPSAIATTETATPETVAWSGFRGPGRDGRVSPTQGSGARLETDWSTSPPIELWRRPVGPGWSSFAVSGDLLYTQEQRGDEEVVACYNAQTGKPVWVHGDPARFFESNAGAGPRGTPTLSDGRVYTLGATGILNTLDARHGAVVWSRSVVADGDLKVPEWGFSSSPLVTEDLVIVAASGRLMAYDLTTGKPRWSGPADSGSYSSPHRITVDGIEQILLMNGGGATSVAPTDGKVFWKHSWKGFPMVQPAQMPDGDLLISASQGSGIRRLAVAHNSGSWATSERWTSMGLKPYFNDFVIHQGHAFGFDGRILSCVELEHGERQWKGGRYGSGQLVLLPDQDLLLVLAESGELALVEAKPGRFQELARFPAIQGKTWNHPVLVGDLLLVRNAEEMAAFRLPEG